MPATITGLEILLSKPPPWLFAQRLGLLCNPASVDRDFRHARDLIRERFPGQLTALFSPQHGFFAEKQDNMVESADQTDPGTGLPVHSLYGRHRQPTADMFAGIDALIVDLQDVGTRVYTFATTLSYCLEQAARSRKRVLVLDRPNPINGIQVEGNCLEKAFASFVGRYPIPMRHGLTMGELALYVNGEHDVGCRLEVVAMKGWRRSMFFADTGLPWVPPSPNLPTPGSAMVYPGQVIFEGTNISEGRGTTTPFEIFGAPFIDPERIISFMGGRHFPGGVLRPIIFEPMFHKWQSEPCRGFHLHITDPRRYRSYETSLRLLQAVIFHHPDAFSWKEPPYEYEWDRLPFDLITGSDRIRNSLTAMEPVETMAGRWHSDIRRFSQAAGDYHIYE